MDEQTKKADKVILVVDDAPENLDIMTSLLSDQYQVKAAINGKIALKIAEKQRPDLILLDVMMPEMDGYEVCRQLKANRVTSEIPVIFLTALDGVDDETQGLKLGAVDYIAKPLNPSILLTRIDTHLSLDETRRQLAEQNQALKEAARMREDVERIMHHDLKGPLSSIISIPALFKEYDNLTERQQEFMEMLEGAGWRMLSMIEMSLILLKIEYGTYQPDLKEESLPDLLQKVVREMSQAFRKKQLDLQLEISEPLQKLTISTEPLLIYNLLSNLLKNACEASPRDKPVRIQLTQEAGTCQLVIENSGEVPEEIRSRFFDKFVTSGKKQGTGLGTYSAKLIARVLNMDLQLDTSLPGHTRLLLNFLCQ
ncbi:hybrid sensor histidine kinase/response regulator [Marinospirillum sp.]|uniref:hybrid sensor histidine kinase/response regulator n=1 Tax=Marinospirillum sp. TaxID=2183934 RepID=UPI002870310E|nr:hybrid sensor histidine kinase/response regulator [Marinospirillum sp.]MDR9467945.1 hybrid sensor histidine kinase/response regulator [Marinospirillum sp.]